MVFESGRRAPPPLLAQWGLIDGSGGLDNLTSGIFDGVDSVDELALGQPDGGRAGARVAARAVRACEAGPPASGGAWGVRRGRAPPPRLSSSRPGPVGVVRARVDVRGDADGPGADRGRIGFVRPTAAPLSDFCLLMSCVDIKYIFFLSKTTQKATEPLSTNSSALWPRVCRTREPHTESEKCSNASTSKSA